MLLGATVGLDVAWFKALVGEKCCVRVCVCIGPRSGGTVT